MYGIGMGSEIFLFIAPAPYSLRVNNDEEEADEEDDDDDGEVEEVRHRRKISSSMKWQLPGQHWPLRHLMPASSV